MTKNQVKKRNLVERKKKMKNREKCEICREERAVIQWTPFEAILMMSDIKKTQLKLESIRICGKCKGRVYKMQRSDSESFYNCETLEDIIKTVKERFLL